jgi:undecaprenyl-diphosphatase
MQVAILEFFQQIGSPFLDILGKIVTMAGEQVLFIAVISCIYWNISKASGYAMTFTLMVSTVANGMLKILFHTPRPFQVLDAVEGKRLSTAEGFAFPSGHTQGAATFFTSTSIYLGFRRYFPAALLISILVALSRLYLGVHWPIDVAGGLVLGILFALLIFKRIERMQQDKRRAQRISLITAVASALLLLLTLILEWTGTTGHDYFYSLNKLLAITLGFSLGSYLERKTTDFSTDAPLSIKVGRYLLGLVGAMLILYGLKLILPSSSITTALRYFLAGFWAFFVYPAIGSKIMVGTSGQTLFISRQERS